MSRTKTVTELLAYTPPGRRGSDYTRPAAVSVAIEALTPLDVKRRIGREYLPIALWIQKGNSKAIDLPDETGAMNFPRVSQFKQIAKAAAHSAEGLIADGKSEQAAAQLMDVIQMSERIGFQGQIDFMVSSAMQAIALSALSRADKALSEPAWNLIFRRTNALLAAKPPYADLWKGEEAEALHTIDEMMEDAIGWDAKEREEQLSYENEEDPGLVAVVRNMAAWTPEQMKRAHVQMREAIKAHYRGLIMLMEGPESAWSVFDVKESDPTVQYFTGLFTQFSGKMLTVVQRSRTRLRLLSVHAAVMRYQWTFDGLPIQLADVLSASQLNDPLTGRPYGFELRADSTFRLFSFGNKETGEIQMVGKANFQDDDAANP